MSYLLQEIYGIENKNNQETKVSVKRLPYHSALKVHSCFICFTFNLTCFLFPFVSSHQMTRTVTTAMSVLFVCLTCETRSSCPADICVSATPAQTLCVTRPTTVQSAGCVRRLSLFLVLLFKAFY